MLRHRSLRRVLRLLVATSALVAPALAGCQSLSLPGKLPWSKETLKESEYQAPVRMAVLWAEDVMTSQGQTPARGFGARIYFYNEKNQTIPVEGQLVVYGYDDSKGDVSSRAPDRKFVFTAEQFSQHYGKSDLGASYSIWIPWDPIGGPQKEVSLIPVFTSSAGKVVVGPQGANILRGPNGEKPSGDKQSRSDRRTQPSPNVRTVAYWEREGQANEESADGVEASSPVSEAASTRKRASSIRTSTIFVPNTLGRRMAADAAEGVPNSEAETSEPRPIPGSAAASPMGTPANAQNYAPVNGATFGAVQLPAQMPGTAPGQASGFAPGQLPSQPSAYAPYGAGANVAPNYPASYPVNSATYSANVGSLPGAVGPIDPRFAALGNFAPAGANPNAAGNMAAVANGVGPYDGRVSAAQMNSQAPQNSANGTRYLAVPVNGYAPPGSLPPGYPTPGPLPAGSLPSQFPAPAAPFAQ